MNNPDISIVIVSYNVAQFLMQTLASIYANKTNVKYEVFVVDNASIDNSVELTKLRYPDVNLIVNQENVGFAAANNQAISKSRAPYVLLLNPDTVLSEDTLEVCYNLMEKKTEVGALGVKMIDGTGQYLPESKRQLPSIWNSFCKLTYLSDLFPRSKWFSGYYLGHIDENQEAAVEVLCGAFMFIRQEALQKAGLLDEAFFMYGEDIDLSYRISKKGYKIYYTPSTSIIHYKGESTKKSSISYIKTFYGAMDIYVQKHYTDSHGKLFARILGAAIWIRGVISAIITLFRLIGRLLIDFIAIVIGLWVLKVLWANYYFKNIDYYDGSYIDFFIVLYGVIWVNGAYFSGWYSKESNPWHASKAIFYSTGIILVIYGLLPENMRTSRAILGFGSLWAWLVLQFGRKVFAFAGNNQETKLGIVARQENALNIQDRLKHNTSLQEIYFISPDIVYDKSFFTNNLSQLNKLVSELKIDELIFSTSDMPLTDIIHIMSNLKLGIKYKIAGDKNLGIIGSNSKHMQGDIYTLDMTFNLDKTHLKVAKRSIDLLLCLIAILLSPILWPMQFASKKYWWDIYQVWIGYKTWVGFGSGSNQDLSLPRIKPSIMAVYFPNRYEIIDAEVLQERMINYAKHYHPWHDIAYFFSHLYKLGQHSPI